MVELNVKLFIKTKKDETFLNQLEKLCTKYADTTETGTAWSFDYRKT